MARLLTLAAALSVYPACVKTPVTPEPKDPQAVGFDAYLSRGVATRAGYAGILDNDILKAKSLRTEGFGVFAYYTEGAVYGPEVEPNFMYNTSVTDSNKDNVWEYSPIKYWPNESSASDDDLIDRLSFFAYAPYVEVAPLSGLPTSDVDNPRGIIQLTTSIDKNDPKVTYKASCIPSRSVDLCWATPTLNMERPADISTKVQFQFHHALASLNIQIDAAFDEITTGVNKRADSTRIYVRYVTFEGFAIQGVLDLNNNSSTTPPTPSWTGLSGLPLSREEVTVHDGRLDGLEAKYADELETPFGLNAGIIQEESYNYRPGVTNTLRNLFDTSEPTLPVFVIPNGYPMTVTIAYDVETKDDKLLSSYLADGKTHGSVTTVRVRQPIAISSDPLRLAAGMKYVIRMHLGMTSVKFEAGLTDEWADDNEVIILHPVTMGQEVVTHTATDGGWS